MGVQRFTRSEPALKTWRRSPAFMALAVVAAVSGTCPPAFGQPNGNEMCGDGTTFTVQLPGTTLGIDDSLGIFRIISAPPSPPDSVTLPNGCRIYAFFVSGYGNNGSFNDIPFYKVAEFVAHNNGYVHTSWWNNFNKEYQERPLHEVDIVIRRLFGLIEDVVIPPTPATAGLTAAGAFVPGGVDLPKANPDEDYQFQSDAALVIREVRARNPEAIIIVAGHSMGGNAVARLGMTRDLEIDLLAPIDPVGNRDKPRVRALPGGPQYLDTWTRWRVANRFRGWKQWDCVRNGLGLCRDFDPRLLHTSYQCAPVGEFLQVKPIIASRAPFICRYSEPYADPPARQGYGTNIKYLYHRWQHEFFWPVDFPATERLLHPAPLSASVLGRNYQWPVTTCSGGPDPVDPTYNCTQTDGHGEVLGHRGDFGADRPALEMPNWPRIPAERRQAMIAMTTADDSWVYRPVNPDLCLVCDDMITIVQHLLDTSSPSPTIDTTAPIVLTEATPSPNEYGWNNEDVVVSLTAQDERNGSGVRDIVTSLSGAQPGGGTTPGASATETIAEQGETTVEYHASDRAGNLGTPATVVVNIDRTPPEIASETDPPANAHGWHQGDVTVTFEASDALSGLANAPTGAVVSQEGAAQEVTGAAEDRAGNAASASVVVNLDRTAPSIALDSPSDSAVYLLKEVVPATYTCNDALSGMDGCAGSTASGASVDTATVGPKSFRVDGEDLAGNAASLAHEYEVHYRFEGSFPAVPKPGGRVRPGRVIPLAWKLADASGVPVGDPASFVSLVSAPIACNAAPQPILGGEPAEAPGASGPRFDGAQWKFLWKTSRAWTGCRLLQLTLADGTRHTATFNFR